MIKSHFFKIINQRVVIIIITIMTIITPLHFITARGIEDAFSDNTIKMTGEVAGYDTTKDSVLPIVANIVNIVYELIGVIFFILIIYGGILWMTAGGKDEQVKKAQNIIQRSAIGLFIVVLAYAITYFILNVVFRVQHVPLKYRDYYITT
ncbi:MAG TPA: pilin [bacterium]|nr:pilin [bacterium]